MNSIKLWVIPIIFINRYKKPHVCKRSIDVANVTITNLTIRKNFKITCQEVSDLN